MPNLMLAPSLPVSGFGQGALDGPAKTNDPEMQRVHRYTDHPRPLGQRVSCSFELKDTRRPPIVCLLNPRGPSAVVGFIVPVWIGEPIKGVTWRWTFSHVAQKRREVTVPCFADADPAAAVIGIRQMSNVAAPCSRLRPCVVFGHPAHAVRSQLGAGPLTRQATTTPRRSALEVPALYNDRASTRASALPVDTAAIARGHADYRQARKGAPGNVNDWSSNHSAILHDYQIVRQGRNTCC